MLSNVRRSVWDHPCDDYYKNMYKEEKQKLGERKVKDAEKMRAEKARRERGPELTGPIIYKNEEEKVAYAAVLVPGE